MIAERHVGEELVDRRAVAGDELRRGGQVAVDVEQVVHLREQREGGDRQHREQAEHERARRPADTRHSLLADDRYLPGNAGHTQQDGDQPDVAPESIATGAAEQLDRHHQGGDEQGRGEQACELRVLWKQAGRDPQGEQVDARQGHGEQDSAKRWEELGRQGGELNRVPWGWSKPSGEQAIAGC